MSSILFIEPIACALSSKAKCSPLVVSTRVSSTQMDNDKSQLCSLIETAGQLLMANHNIYSHTVRLNHESKAHKRLYEDKGEAAFARSSISFHDFTDEEGNIVRRMVVLYPITPGRQGELSVRQLLAPLEEAAEEEGNALELVDLRGFQETGQYLEGMASVVLSADGRFAYMSLSARSDEEVFDILCEEENFNIPPENRFVFSSEVPLLVKNDYNEIVPDLNKMEALPHTNVLGWVGKGICAWALDNLVFESEEEQERFFRHLETEYEVVLELNEAELRAFAGDAVELACPDGGRILVLSETSKAALTREHLRALEEWYGAENIVTFYGTVVERRFGASLPSCMAVSNTHGPVPPNRRPGAHPLPSQSLRLNRDKNKNKKVTI
ncbi:hypothetical protein AGDE_08315 [Angomonas deanei]|uniref:Amidinotransferase, putative n=1 Tax=Angomonas deanei TaxID=59799 RepID=A0A7G2C552_9TRYP|nr:hypothetical protein AGDE_08315 [Angomonas deanei]CAD2214856.1 Amidinotransferase, putative [Angomonas deanei]|eukprot:EPY33175.1 hypothetical protein AGDE_08315 [Angomonas deanei]